MPLTKNNKRIVDHVKNSPLFYTVFGLVDGLDVSIGSLSYFCKALSLTKDNEKSLLTTLLSGNWQLATLGFISVITGLSLTGQYHAKKHPETTLMSTRFWTQLRYLLKSSHNAVKTRFCLLPILNHPCFRDIINPLSPTGLVFMGVCTISRAYHKYYSDKIKFQVTANLTLLEQINEFNEKPHTHLSIELIIELHTKIKKTSNVRKLQLYMTAALAGLIDKPHMFYALLMFSVTSTQILFLLASFFILFALASGISKVLATHNHLCKLESSQHECENQLKHAVYQQPMLFSGNARLETIPTDLLSTCSVQPSIRHGKINQLSKQFEGVLNIINFTPLSNIIVCAQFLIALPLSLHCALGLAVMSVGITVCAAYCSQQFSDYLPGKADISACLKVLSASFISYFKGIRLSNFYIKNYIEHDDSIISLGIKLSSTSILSLESVAKNFGSQTPTVNSQSTSCRPKNNGIHANSSPKSTAHNQNTLFNQKYADKHNSSSVDPHFNL